MCRAGLDCARLFICNDTENLHLLSGGGIQSFTPQSFSLGPSLSLYLFMGPKQR